MPESRRMPDEQGPATEVRYRIDAGDRLVAFNASWNDFAESNGKPSLRGDNIVGRSLWDFITSPDVRQLHELLVARARATDQTLVYPFRCDAPDLRRYMEMEMQRLPDGGVEFRCRLLRAERRAPVLTSFVATPGHGHLFLRMCSWCNRFDAGGGLWLEIEDAAVRMQLFSEEKYLMVSHVLCDDCFARLERNV